MTVRPLTLNVPTVCGSRWQHLFMLSERDCRDLLEQVVSDLASEGVEVEWLPPERWCAHARLVGTTGLVGYLLTTPEWQEARFTDPHRSTFMLTDGSDRDDVKHALERLARAVKAYVSGAYRVDQKRGLFGTRACLVLDTPDGQWRIGKRGTTGPSFAE